MNTTKKGNEFEDKVFSIIEDLLDNGDFFVDGKRSQIFQKKAYYSRDRDSDIITDISIETYLPEADTFSLLTIIECKNLEHKVPVDDVEEFDSKINQLGEHNTKGILITKTGFQRGALKVGKSKKFGLCIVQDQNKLQWINYRKDKRTNIAAYEDASKRILGDIKLESNFCGISDCKSYNNIPEFLIDIGIIDLYEHQAKYVDVKYLKTKEIQYGVESLFGKEVYTEGKLDTDKLCQRLSKLKDLNFEFNQYLGEDILGKVIYGDNTILLNKNLIEDEGKWRFTLAHEVGHYILHSKYSDQLNSICDKNICLDNFNESNQNKRMEIQANFFASFLLIPWNPLKRLVRRYFIEERINKGFLYLDHQMCNQQIVMKFLIELQKYFNVSISVAKYRLIGLGLLKDDSDISINSIVRRGK